MKASSEQMNNMKQLAKWGWEESVETETLKKATSDNLLVHNLLVSDERNKEERDWSRMIVSQINKDKIILRIPNDTYYCLKLKSLKVFWRPWQTIQ